MNKIYLVLCFLLVPCDGTEETSTAAIPGTKEHPGTSCKALKEHDEKLKTGMYWILLGNATQVYCDMDHGRGGWTMVGHAVVEKESESKDVDSKKLLSNDLSRIGEVTKKRFLLGPDGLIMLHKYIGFKQIRLYCRKPWRRRTVHIHTTTSALGKAVLDYMLRKTMERPKSCNSFVRLYDDNSNLGRQCAKWFDQKWGGWMYFPMFIAGRNQFSLSPGKLECDDYYRKGQRNFRRKGEWAFYVR